MIEFDFMSALIVLLLILRLFNYKNPLNKGKRHHKPKTSQHNPLKIASSSANTRTGPKKYSPLYTSKSKVLIIVNLLLFISVTLFLFYVALLTTNIPTIRQLLMLCIVGIGIVEIHRHYKAINCINAEIHLSDLGFWIKWKDKAAYYPLHSLNSVSSYSLNIYGLHFDGNEEAIYIFKEEQNVKHLFEFINENRQYHE